MCLINNRYRRPRVSLSGTIETAFNVRNESGDVEHTLGYKVGFNVSGAPSQSDDDAQPEGDIGWEQPARGRKSKKKTQGNAILLAIPVAEGSVLDEHNLIPLNKLNLTHVMSDYARAVTPQRPIHTLRRGGPSFGKGMSDAPVVVKGFDGNLYDVVFSNRASDIASVIRKVDANKRPSLNEELYAELDTVYPDFFRYLLFCYDEKDAGKAGSVMVRYTPHREDLLFLPALDGHNGTIERGEVELDHTLVVGSYDMSRDAAAEFVSFTDLAARGTASDVLTAPVHRGPSKPRRPGTPRFGSRRPGDRSGAQGFAPGTPRPYYLVDRVIGKAIEKGTKAPQGDFLCSVEEVEKGIFRARKQVPPGWKKLSDKPKDPAGRKAFYITADSDE